MNLVCIYGVKTIFMHHRELNLLYRCNLLIYIIVTSLLYQHYKSDIGWEIHLIYTLHITYILRKDRRLFPRRGTRREISVVDGLPDQSAGLMNGSKDGPYGSRVLPIQYHERFVTQTQAFNQAELRLS